MGDGFTNGPNRIINVGDHSNIYIVWCSVRLDSGYAGLVKLEQSRLVDITSKQARTYIDR